MRFLLLLVLSLSVLSLFAQKKRWQYSAIHQLGVLSGSSGEAFQIQSIHGIKKKNYFIGAGLGIDYYHTRTVPVFAAFRMHPIQQQAMPWLYLDLGVSAPWATDQQKGSNMWGVTNKNYRTTLFWDAGIAFRLTNKKDKGLLLQFGYSAKEMRYAYDAWNWIRPWPSTPEQTTTNVREQFKRLSIKLGWQL
ncbi:MAG: hypothetical protein K2Y12_00025 [Chitinophagaceae bacterium]|nr:hypothetical protein [Chitinophagaceae bacterium]